MSDIEDITAEARPRPRRQLPWIWLVPLLAAAVVAWLGAAALADRGPLITISFNDAEGLQAGDTRIRHKNVDIGTVESISLTPDLSRVIVRARMRRSATEHLTTSTRFWIVRPRVGAAGISGLSTLVSGAYIEMYPAEGEAQRSFVGLDEPPVLTPDTPGRSYTLQTDDLGSLSGGSQVSFRGVPVGEVEGYALDPSGKHINVYTFVRAPFVQYVNAKTRFWNSGGIDVSVGAQGVRFRASTWQQLISGGVSFDTPETALNDPPSAAGSGFRLYDNQGDANSDPRGETLTYRANFYGTSLDISPGTAVLLQGADIGRVTETHLQYDDQSRSMRTQATLVLDPSRVEVVKAERASNGSAAAVSARLANLVTRGLRAHVMSANFLTGTKVVSLDMVPDVPADHVRQVNGYILLPSVTSTDLTQILADAQRILHHVDVATAGPALGHAIQEFDRTLTNLDRITSQAQPQIEPLLKSVREAADAAQRTLQSANSLLGNSAASSADLPRLMRELTEAARSLRDLTDFLDRHPESLLRGRKGDEP